MHHGDRPFDTLDTEAAERMSKLLSEHRQSALGATGEFPEGKLSAHDEGEIRFAIGHQRGKVVLEFGKPVAWVGMDPNQAIALASSLIAHAKRARIIGADATKTEHTVAAK